MGEKIRVSFETHTPAPPPRFQTRPVLSAILRIVSVAKQEILSNNCSLMESENNIMVAEFFQECELQWDHVWDFTDSIILVTGVLANAAMLWVLLRDKNAFTASQVGASRVVTLEVEPRRPTRGQPASKQREMSHIRS